MRTCVDIPVGVDLRIKVADQGLISFVGTDYRGIALQGRAVKLGKVWHFTWKGKNGRVEDERRFRSRKSVVNHIVQIAADDIE